jgi:hypothetical protein
LKGGLDARQLRLEVRDGLLGGGQLLLQLVHPVLQHQLLCARLVRLVRVALAQLGQRRLPTPHRSAC